MANGIEDTLSWYVVHTHPKQEERANGTLQSWGVETLSAKLRVNKYNEFTGQVSRLVKPLFPSYIFARFKFNNMYHRIRFARGVHSLVCFCNKAAPVDDEMINLIRSRMGNDGFVKTTDDLKVGDEVIINEGRFQNLCGVFERELPDTERVRILLSTIGFQAHVVVNKNLVSKFSASQRPPASLAI
ncbi:MAG TPA: transcription termination/antitermination NusG family protein [Pyrinomonadaceae bacterium]|nr:transcription termination/antitermination NusG family protein [Pyrinomonadaceae bacterium]